MLTREYLGVVALLLEDWFAIWEGLYAFDRLTMRGWMQLFGCRINVDGGCLSFLAVLGYLTFDAPWDKRDWVGPDKLGLVVQAPRTSSTSMRLSRSSLTIRGLCSSLRLPCVDAVYIIFVSLIKHLFFVFPYGDSLVLFFRIS